MKRILCSLAVILISLYSHAAKGAEIEKSLHFNAGMGYCGISDIENINDRLALQRYQTFKGWYITTGGHLRLQLNNLFFGASSYGFRSATRRNGELEYLLKGGYTLFEAGYYVYSTGNLHLYPALGIGRGDVTLGIYERSNQDFNDILYDPSAGAEVSRGCLIVNVSAGADYFWKIFDFGGPLLGIKAGYNYEIAGAAWNMFQQGRGTGTDVNNAPDISFTGFCGHLSIGWKLLF